MPTSPRHMSFSQEPAIASKQAGENARDTIQALGARMVGTLITVSRYAATGSTANRIYLQQPTSGRPRAVMLARIFASNDPGADVGFTWRPNFYHDSRGVGIYEPGGLVANTLYDMTFLVLE